MSFRTKLGELIAGKKAFINQDSVDRPSGVNLYNVSNLDLVAIWGQYTDGNLTTLYHTMGEVFIPVHIISTLVAGAKWQLRKKSDNSVVTDNSYMNALMEKPNPLQNWPELIYQKEAYELVTGKNYMYANTVFEEVSYRTLSTLVNLPADSVQIQQQPILKLLSATKIEDLIKSFIVPNASEGLTSIPPHMVMYTKLTSLKAIDLSIKGASPLLSVQKNIGNLIAVYDARNIIYTKRGALGFIVSKKGDADGMQALSKPEKEELQKDLQSYGVTKGKNPLAITGVPVDYIKVAATIAELEPFKETLEDACVIFGVYQVPRELMPGNSGATYENFNHALKTLYQNVIITRAESTAKSLTNFLGLAKFGFYLHADFSHIEVLQENKKEKANVDWRNNEIMRVRFANGICTLNDWRIAASMEAVPNAMYNKLIYDMTPEELTKVETILKITGATKTSGSNTGTSGGEGQTGSDGPTD